MSTLILLIFITLVLFATLAIIDGFYLHLWKFKLYRQKESRQEHLVHTVRALIFPFILVLVFLYDFSGWLWYAALGFVLLDIMVLTLDMYMEKDSRAFMGGLPRWEYILHMFVNGFHFAGIALVIATKSPMAWQWSYIPHAEPYHEYLTVLAKNLLPGAVLLGLLHWGLLYRPLSDLWQKAQHNLQAMFDPNLVCCQPNNTNL